MGFIVYLANGNTNNYGLMDIDIERVNRRGSGEPKGRWRDGKEGQQIEEEKREKRKEY